LASNIGRRAASSGYPNRPGATATLHILYADADDASEAAAILATAEVPFVAIPTDGFMEPELRVGRLRLTGLDAIRTFATQFKASRGAIRLNL